MSIIDGAGNTKVSALIDYSGVLYEVEVSTSRRTVVFLVIAEESLSTVATDILYFGLNSERLHASLSHGASQGIFTHPIGRWIYVFRLLYLVDPYNPVLSGVGLFKVIQFDIFVLELGEVRKNQFKYREFILKTKWSTLRIHTWKPFYNSRV